MYLRLGAPVRDSFFRWEDESGSHYPLASLMSSRSGKAGGGRGGKTRLALYLSLLWVAAGKDHSSNRPTSTWAALLGLSDPDRAGGRAIRATWKELEQRGFVTISPAAKGDEPPTITPLREDGSRRPYKRPQGLEGDTYRRIPELAWRSLFPDEELTGPGLAMYLVALRTAGKAQTTSRLVFPADYFREEYGLGESTRKAGLRNLSYLGVLDARQDSTDPYGDPSRRRRRRNTYDLLEAYASPPPISREETERPAQESPENRRWP